MIIDTEIPDIDAPHLALFIFLVEKYGEEDDDGNKFAMIGYDEITEFFLKKPKCFMYEDKENKEAWYRVEYDR